MADNPSLTAGQLHALIAAAGKPPSVTAYPGDERERAVLLVWARHPQAGWIAGISYLHKNWHSRALITMWLPADRVKGGHDRYDRVPRVHLTGPATDWPPLPPIYPDAGEAWTAHHQHALFVPPTPPRSSARRPHT